MAAPAHDRQASRRRMSKRALRIWAAVAGLAGFALPWAAIRALPVPTATAPPPRVIVVPAGTKVVMQTGKGGTGGVSLIAGTAPAAPTPPAVTSGSKPPP